MPISREINPRLIYCALKGFLSGPYEHRPALDEVVQFMAGLAYMTGPPGQPLRAGSSVVDIMGGMFAVIAHPGGAARARAHRPRPIGQIRVVRIDRVSDDAAHGRPGGDRPGAAADAGARRRLGDLRALRDRRRRADFRRADQRPAMAPLLRAFRARGSCCKIQPIRPTRTACARVRCCCRSSPQSSAGTSLPSLPNCSTASIYLLLRWQNLATCSTIRSSMPEAACSKSNFPNGVRAKIPRLPIEIGAHDLALRRQAPAIGEHTSEILAELGFAPEEIAALAHAAASSRQSER